MTTTSNLALIHRSILRSINDSIPNQIPTARNFPALSLTRPEHHPSCHPSIHPPLLHRHHRKVPQPASHARKDCGERNEKPISQKPKAKERSQRPRRNEPQRCVAAATSAQTINGETRKATKKSFGYRSFVSLAQVSRQKERKEKDLNRGCARSLPHPCSSRGFFVSVVHVAWQQRLITCSLELSCGECGSFYFGVN
jgi:hypothetical protein